MNELFESARVISHQFLNFEKNHLKKEINLDLIKIIIEEKVCALDYYESINRTDLAEVLMADFSVGKGEITVMAGDKIEPWLNNVRGKLEWELWNRYKLYMQEKDPSFPVNDLDDFTDKILDKCENPQKLGPWDRRGMVVGHVQSGKTSNYVGLINKAVDAGYKLIIIIAGTMNSLRRQTQERVDEGFIGTHSAKGITIGVGHYNTKVTIYPLTSSSIIPDGDFDQKTATRKGIPIGNNPVVLVIKKNKSILENLIDWLASNPNSREINGEVKLCGVPTLVIDDEADAASVNSISGKKDKSQALEDIKTINKLIRSLLNLFEKNTFIGYTATPYANLFIPQEWSETKEATVRGKKYKVGEDLFPRDFIINIRAAKNYIGAAKFFGLENPITGVGTEPWDIFRSVEDYDPPFFKKISKENRDDLPDYLPQSLKKAIMSFILTTAVRRLRGHAKKHNSMLIHVALYVKWIDRVAKLVNEELKNYKNYIAAGDKNFISQLRNLYEEDFLTTTQEVMDDLDYDDPRINLHSWNDVRAELVNAASKIEVRAVHGVKSISNLEYNNIDEIDYTVYSEGFSVIAVGGSRLARGITLEGLSVSYYLRTTKMYDSLMQMGRWFGYRPGYVDLCRLFTTNEIYGWFNHITMATEEMRYDFDEMTALLKRPKDFRLKVRNHHGLLAITSVSKLFWAEEVRISFSGQNPQTYQLLRTKESIEGNFSTFQKLVSKLGFPPDNQRQKINGRIKYLIYRSADIGCLCEFLSDFTIDQPTIKNATLSDYIRKQAENGKVTDWNIVVVSNTDQAVFIDKTGDTPRKNRIRDTPVQTYKLDFNGESLTLGCVVRNQKRQTRTSGYYFISKNQIDDTKDRQVDLTSKNLKDNREIKALRAKEKKGLLLIYPLDERGTSGVSFGIPIIGFSLHFPTVENETLVVYTATTNKELDFDNMEDDDE
jgi:hypothetical protein